MKTAKGATGTTGKGWPARLRAELTELYEGDSPASRRFRYTLLVFDVSTVLFIVGSSFLPRVAIDEWVDALLGAFILCDFSARLFISRSRVRDLLHPSAWADIVAIGSFLAPIVGEGAGFLRVLRTLRLLRTYHLVAQLRGDFAFFRRYEEVLIAVVNLGVFIFVMTALVYETQHWRNPAIGNYVDALYFTITTLTTTGFGDITLEGTPGHLVAVIIMIFGVTLFLRLVQVLLRPHKVRYSCPGCGLQRHEVDAVHCKACGTLLHIPDEGRF